MTDKTFLMWSFFLSFTDDGRAITTGRAGVLAGAMLGGALNGIFVSLTNSLCEHLETRHPQRRLFASLLVASSSAHSSAHPAWPLLDVCQTAWLRFGSTTLRTTAPTPTSTTR